MLTFHDTWDFGGSQLNQESMNLCGLFKAFISK